jgi:hypothetical protein
LHMRKVRQPFRPGGTIPVILYAKDYPT